MVLPLAAPAMIMIALFNFIAAWNDFITPSIFLNDGGQYPLSIMLLNVRNGALPGSVEGLGLDYGAMQAGVVVAVLPVLLVYLLLQRYFVTGLTTGALRG